MIQLPVCKEIQIRFKNRVLWKCIDNLFFFSGAGGDTGGRHDGRQRSHLSGGRNYHRKGKPVDVNFNEIQLLVGFSSS